MKLILLMMLLLSTNAFAKRSKKGGLYIEPIVGYSVYTKEKFEALGTTTDLSVGHGGTSYGARLGADIGYLMIGVRYLTTPKTTFSAEINGVKLNTDEFSFNQSGVYAGLNIGRIFRLYGIYDLSIDTKTDGVKKKYKSIGSGLNVKLGPLDLIVESAKIEEDDNPDHEDQLFTFSLGIPLTLF